MKIESKTSQPTQMPRAPLRGFERAIVPFHEKLNQSARGQRGIAFWQRHAAGRFVRWLTRERWQIQGLERIQAAPPKRGTILVSNHRSFFDMFVTLSVLFVEYGMYRNLFFPVRATFFYTNPLGPFVSGLFSGFSMWPPVFRDSRRTTLNPIGVRQLLEVLEQPGSCIGVHPEGRRHSHADPSVFLPAKPGIGHMVLDTHPDTMIVPMFIEGLNNDFMDQVWMRVLPARRRNATPIRWVFGDPIRAGDLREKGDPQAIADYILHEKIAELASEAETGHQTTAHRQASAGG
jgi:1-acyl-sn-glycerol-3-phosphate acyltransferase